MSEIWSKIFIGLNVKCPVIFPILMKLEFSRKIFLKHSNMKFHENRPVGAELFNADRQIGMAKLVVAFRNFANALKKLWTLKMAIQMMCYSAHARVFRFSFRFVPGCDVTRNAANFMPRHKMYELKGALPSVAGLGSHVLVLLGSMKACWLLHMLLCPL